MQDESWLLFILLHIVINNTVSVLKDPPEHLDCLVFQLLLNSPFPSDLVRGLQMLARARAKRLAARDAFDLV